jgi:hypothetical protein
MKLIAKTLILVVGVVLGSFAFAQEPGKSSANPQQQATAASAQTGFARSAIRSQLATSLCAFTFTSGSGETFVKYCVTANGNITQLEMPQFHEHLAAGAFGEGYGICDASFGVEYFDYADFGDSVNWGPATLVTQSATLVKIARTTADGAWTLTQNITMVPGTSPTVKVAMALRNNTTTDRVAFLMRYADVDANSSFINSFGATSNSGFGWDPTVFANIGLRGNFGVNLVADALPQQLSPDLGPQGFTQSTPAGPSPCNPYSQMFAGLNTAADGSVVAIYELGVPKKGSKSVTMHYKGM